MKIHDCAQGSPEWMLLRAGIPTASEFDNLVTPLWKARTGQTPQGYLARKLAEKWLHGPLMGGSQFFNADQGHILEREAIPWFELEYGTPIRRVGFVSRDDGKVGCSPDGMLLDDTCGIEIKCPEPQTHVGYLLAGALPEDYRAQVQGSMFVTGLTHWKFVSYRRHFPALVLDVARDEAAQEVIGTALEAFLKRFDAGYERLLGLNGGIAPAPPESDDSASPNYHINVSDDVPCP